MLNTIVHLYQTNRLFRFISLLLFSSFLGLAWFILLYDRYALYLTNVNWIYQAGRDVFQHQIGWEWFRQEPWRFPFGTITAYGYPFGTNVSFTDSIPLMAIFFKIISPLYRQTIQYLGLWALVSIICQIFMGILILGEFTDSILRRSIGASLLVLSPILLLRFFSHDSLTAQWIILAGIWFCILEYRHKLWRGAWVVLFLVAILVHLYFVAMLFPLWAICLFFRYAREKKKRLLILDLFSVIGAVLFVGYCIGLFSLDISHLAKNDFGYYSWNLNGFINPTYSSIFRQLKTGTNGQYEGYSYLGLGNLVILPFALFLFISKKFSSKKWHAITPFIFIAIVYMIFALSNKAYINTQRLWDIHLSPNISNTLSIFHASGRFIWPVFYFIVLFGIISLIRSTRYASICLLLVLVIQFIDIRPIYNVKKITGFDDYQSSLQSKLWQLAAETNKHVFLMWEQRAIDIYEPIALFARQNNLTLNWGYFGRGDYQAIGAYAWQTWANLQAQQTDNQTIYLFWGSEWEKNVKVYLSSFMVVCPVDKFIVVFSRDNGILQYESELASECAYP